MSVRKKFALALAVCMVAVSPGLCRADSGLSDGFPVQGAMELLFGNYDAARKVSFWKDISVPPEERFDEFSQVASGIVAPAFNASFEEDGVRKHLFVTKTVPSEDPSCHACSTLLSLAVFHLRADGWAPARVQPYFAVAGSWGEAPKIELVEVGAGRFGLVLSSTFTGQGYANTTATIYVPRQGEFREALSLETYGDNAGAALAESERWSYEVELGFVPGSDPGHHDLRAEKSGTEKDDQGRIRPVREVKVYRFENGSYVLASRGAGGDAGGGGTVSPVFEDSDRRFLTDQDLSFLDKEKLWRARNEIFARRGYRFQSDKGKAYAASLGAAYRGTVADAGQVYRSFNEYEKYNVELIKQYEQGKGVEVSEDIEEMTCRGFLARYPEKSFAEAMGFWIDGYLTGSDGLKTVDLYRIQGLGSTLADYCRQHPGEKVLDGVREIFKTAN